MLKLTFDAETLKIGILQRHFYPRVLHRLEYDEYEAHFILNEKGEPILIVEEK